MEKKDIPRISTGEPATLGNYRKIAKTLGGEDSKAVKFFDKKIKEAEKGKDEFVLQEETQVMYLIGELIRKDLN